MDIQFELGFHVNRARRHVAAGMENIGELRAIKCCNKSSQRLPR